MRFEGSGGDVDEELEPITIRMKPSLKQQLHALAVERRMKLYQVAQEAIEAYLGLTEGGGPELKVPPQYRPCMKKVAEILSSGDELAIKAVVSNVEVFHDRLRPAARKAR